MNQSKIVTALRGQIRRLPKSVEKERCCILATQFDGLPEATGEARFRLRRATDTQAALMAGQPLPVISCIEEHAPHVWAVLQEARRRHAAG